MIPDYLVTDGFVGLGIHKVVQLGWIAQLNLHDPVFESILIDELGLIF